MSRALRDVDTPSPEGRSRVLEKTMYRACSIINSSMIMKGKHGGRQYTTRIDLKKEHRRLTRRGGGSENHTEVYNRVVSTPSRIMNHYYSPPTECNLYLVYRSFILSH